MAERWMLEDQIAHNKRATVWLFLVVFLILWGLVFVAGYVTGFPPLVTAGFALVFGLVYLAMASGFSVKAVLSAAGAREPSMQDRREKLYVYAVEEMAIAAGLPKPATYVQDSPDINAFATGRTPEKGVICITTGALEKLSKEEMQGVIGHEMSHIKNADIRVQTYAIALIGIIAMMAEILIRALFFGGGRKMDGRMAVVLAIMAIIFVILAPLLSRMVYMAISRKREYLADASGAHLTRNPEALASALQKISDSHPQQKRRGDKTVASLYLANPFKRVRKASLWATHPPIDDRIARLKRM